MMEVVCALWAGKWPDCVWSFSSRASTRVSLVLDHNILYNPQRNLVSKIRAGGHFGRF